MATGSFFRAMMRSALLVLVLLVAGCATPTNEPGSLPPGAEPTSGVSPEPATTSPTPTTASPAPTVATSAPTATPTAAATPPTDASPVWSFKAIDGATYTSHDPPGNATVVFFMATWCSSCRAKAPLLAEAHATHAASGVRFFSLDFDPSESPGDLRAWKERYGHNWPHGIDEGLKIQRQYQVRSQSTVLVFDGNANLVKHFAYGQVTQQGLDDAIKDALAA